MPQPGAQLNKDVTVTGPDGAPSNGAAAASSGAAAPVDATHGGRGGFKRLMGSLRSRMQMLWDDSEDDRIPRGRCALDVSGCTTQAGWLAGSAACTPQHPWAQQPPRSRKPCMVSARKRMQEACSIWHAHSTKAHSSHTHACKRARVRTHMHKHTHTPLPQVVPRGGSQLAVQAFLHLCQQPGQQGLQEAPGTVRPVGYGPQRRASQAVGGVGTEPAVDGVARSTSGVCGSSMHLCPMRMLVLLHAVRAVNAFYVYAAGAFSAFAAAAAKASQILMTGQRHVLPSRR